MCLCPELELDDKVEYKYVPIGPPPPAPEREEYRKTVHLHSTVPALEIEGRPTMLESSAMCLYLADLCGRLAPKPKDRAEYYEWVIGWVIVVADGLKLQRIICWTIIFLFLRNTTTLLS